MGLSPMMQHYLEIKEKHKDCILFYRLGDFYEMFFEDAVKTSELLDLTLTGRDCGLKERAPMCGVPFHAAETYIAKLVGLGEKVAICEQLTPAVKGNRELVKRDVVKIITAGTMTNNDFMDDKSNNFIGCVFLNDKGVAFSWADITTGEFSVASFDGDGAYEKLVDIMVRVSPVEIIANAKACEIFNELPLIVHGVLPKFNEYLESEYSYKIAENNLKLQLKVLSLDSFGLNDEEQKIIVAGALISYLKETQKHALFNINNIKIERDNDFLMLDANAIKNLELTRTLKDQKKYGSLLWVLDKTKTSMGARKLQSWVLSPLLSIDKINYRLNAVESFYDNIMARKSVIDLLSSVKDIGRIAGKLSNGNLTPKDCYALRKSLEILPSLRFTLSGINSEFICDIVNNLCDFDDIVDTLTRAIDDTKPEIPSLKDGKFIKKGFDEKLDELRDFGELGKDLIAEMEANEREKTGVKTLKISYNRLFGYYIELTNSVKHLAPFYYERKQTLANAERFVTPELKDLEVKILTSSEEFATLELKIFEELKALLQSRIVDLQTTADAVSDLDVLTSLAEVARERGYVKPQMLGYGNALNIVDGRHPVVEALSSNRFVPNDTVIDSNDNRTLIITGPNMAGKSTYMRQIALITLMAHIGSFVPAKSAEIPLTDRIFTRVGASDNLILDKSTFMVEMTEMANILKNATENSLLILDEIGRGTSTYDGLSIAWSVVEYINENIMAKTLFATHYHELTELEGVLNGVKNYKVVVKESSGGIIFVRKIMRGSANRSFGIEVAALAGISEKVTNRAKEILKKLENSSISNKKQTISNDEPCKSLSQTELVLKDIDLNNLTPMQAFNLIAELKEGIKE